MSGKPTRVDWPLIKARMEAAGVDPAASCLVCLSEAGRQLLLAIAEQRLRWEATYRVDGYGYEDWNTLQNYVEDTIGELAVADCSDILSSIVTNVTNNITQITESNQLQDDLCCYVGDGPDNGGQPIFVPPASETPPPGTMGGREELCIQAQVGHDGGREFLVQAFNYIEVFGALTAAALSLLLGVVWLPFALVSPFIAIALALVLDDSTDDALLAWDDLKHDIVCAIVSAASAAEAKIAVDAVIEAAGLADPFEELFKLMYSQAAINKAWNSQYDNPGGYTAAYCNDCQEWVNVGGIAFDAVSKDGTKCVVNGGIGGPTYWMNSILQAGPDPTLPLTFCFVDDGLEAHIFGDVTTNVGFQPTSVHQAVMLGVSTCGTGPGGMYASYTNFKILVSTSENPTAYFWIDALVERISPDIPGQFEVTEGIGAEAGVFVGIAFAGGGTYGEEVRIKIPAF